MLQQIIVLEGPDGAGKSTVAKQLSDKHHFHLVHTGPPKPGENVFQSYAEILFGARSFGPIYDKPHVVFDRFHLGELIYGPIYRNRDGLGFAGLLLLERVLASYGAQTILFLPPYEVCWENIERRGDDFVVDEAKFKAVYEGYEKYKGAYPVYDYTKGEFEHPELILPLPRGFIGSHNPKFLFIGEVANHPSLDLPFMSLTGSSKYLQNCLWLAGFPEPEVTFVNAYDIHGGQNNLVDGWRAIGRPHIITLGNRAVQAWQDQAEFINPDEKARAAENSSSVPHPAYWKRFHSGDLEGYVTRLRYARERGLGK